MVSILLLDFFLHALRFHNFFHSQATAEVNHRKQIECSFDAFFHPPLCADLVILTLNWNFCEQQQKKINNIKRKVRHIRGD